MTTRAKCRASGRPHNRLTSKNFRRGQTFISTPTGFEPVRAKHTRLAGEPLDHSGKVSRAHASGSRPQASGSPNGGPLSGPATCTCGLDGHDARFTRERSRVRVTARVRFFFFFFYTQQQNKNDDEQFVFIFISLFFFFFGALKGPLVIVRGRLFISHFHQQTHFSFDVLPKFDSKILIDRFAFPDAPGLPRVGALHTGRSVFGQAHTIHHTW